MHGLCLKEPCAQEPPIGYPNAMSGYSVAILGATGAVGQEFLKLFEERSFPISNLKLLASERSAGKVAQFAGREVPIEAVTAQAFEGCDLAFFSAGASRSKEFASAAMDAGSVVIDNSSAFRMDPAVPLVVPEINPLTVTESTKLIAVPNCTAIILTMALAPLKALGAIDRVIVSTYQSASGGGAAMMQQLLDETREALSGSPQSAIHNPQSKIPPYAFNLFSHNTPINEHGFNEEEWKVMQETRKILGMPDLKLNVTCIRVPVLRAHSESVTIEFKCPSPSVASIRKALSAAPGIKVVDDCSVNRFPTPLEASGGDDVLVGRIRQDISNPNAICMFIAGDQLRKGAALDAVQIAELIVANRLAAVRS